MFAMCASAGCAIGVTNEDTEFAESSARVSDPDDEDADGDEEDDALPDAGTVGGAPGDSGTVATDAGAKDAGVARDAATMDGGPTRDAGSDTGMALDAAMSLDAGGPTLDASTSVDAGSDAGRDAGRDSGGGGGTRCTASACNNDCSLLGPLRCCRENDSCGCSWAPGAYCM